MSDSDYELDDEAMDRERDRRFQLSVFHSVGLQPPVSLLTPTQTPTTNQPVSVSMPIQYDEGELEAEYEVRADSDDSPYRCEPPQCSYEEAVARDTARVGRGEPRCQPRSPRGSATWCARVLIALENAGLKPAPIDYPVEAAWQTVPSIGQALVLMAAEDLKPCSSQVAISTAQTETQTSNNT